MESVLLQRSIYLIIIIILYLVHSYHIVDYLIINRKINDEQTFKRKNKRKTFDTN